MADANSTAKHFPCHIVNGYQNPNQKEEHSAGLGIEINDDLKVIRLGDGQCRARGVTVGMVMMGINGKSIAECAKAAIGEDAAKNLNADKVGKMMQSVPKPYTLDFNALPNETVAKKELDDTFMSLLQQGIEVTKVHKDGNMFNRMARRIVHMNDAANKIMVSKFKGANTDKVIDVTEVTNVGFSKKQPTKVVIQTKDESKDVTIKLPSEKATEMFAQKLYRHCSQSQEDEGIENVINKGGMLSPRTHRKTVISSP